MRVPLVSPVQPGERLSIELVFDFKVPAKKGRWSYWNDVVALAQWLPTLAVVDNDGWHALPFIPWHQPFYNEAGVYTAKITLPCDKKLAAPCPVKSETQSDGWTCVDTPLAPGESAVGGVSLKQRCEKTTPERHLMVEARFLRKPGQSDIDKTTGEYVRRPKWTITNAERFLAEENLAEAAE